MKTIKNEFNRKAESLGCKARIGGNKKRMQFFEFTGSVSASGHEIIVKIDFERFGKLINNYPTLHN